MTDDFPDFLRAASECGLPSAPSDLALARSYWRLLDVEQRTAALEGLYARLQCGEWNEGYKPLPQSYLGNRLWLRPLRIRNKLATTRANTWGRTPMKIEANPEMEDLLNWATAKGMPLATGADLFKALEARNKEKL
jgi:hypothetical protein